MTGNALDEALLKAHAAGDLSALVDGYLAASVAAEDNNRAAFFLTHAWIFALEAGDPRADDMKAQLIAQGREVTI